MRRLVSLLTAVLLLGQVSARDLAGVIRKIAEDSAFGELSASGAARHMADRIREEYDHDEVAILADAFALDLNQDGNLFYGFWTELGIRPESRIALIERIISSQDPAEQERSWLLLHLSDRKPQAGTEGEYEVDLSAHAAWLVEWEELPQEYALYLFKQDGDQAWKLLKPGAGVDSDPSALAMLGDVLARKDSNWEKRKTWLSELRPRLQDGEGPANSADAAYVAWFLSRIYDSASLVRQNNPELAQMIEKRIPGLGSALMDGLKGGTGQLQRTDPLVAAKWIKEIRVRAGLEEHRARRSPHAGESRPSLSAPARPVGEKGADDLGRRPGNDGVLPWLLGGAVAVLVALLLVMRGKGGAISP